MKYIKLSELGTTKKIDAIREERDRTGEEIALSAGSSIDLAIWRARFGASATMLCRRCASIRTIPEPVSAL